jgi:glycosyltransferase involved in cell wall biosynthesis
MRVVVMCCTLNEELNIERYCKVYSRFADIILICDGGSTDRTVQLAESFPKVEVVHFEEVKSFGGIPWNPKGKQYSFAYSAVIEYNPDWIIVDECDSIPTLPLQKDIRALMKVERNLDVIGLTRLYVLEETQFFPALSLGGFYGWAHRAATVNGDFDRSDDLKHLRPYFPDPNTWRNINPPYALLHFGWPSADAVSFKTRRYRAVGVLPGHGDAIPSDAGPAVPLPKWAKWN